MFLFGGPAPATRSTRSARAFSLLYRGYAGTFPWPARKNFVFVLLSSDRSRSFAIWCGHCYARDCVFARTRAVPRGRRSTRITTNTAVWYTWYYASAYFVYLARAHVNHVRITRNVVSAKCVETPQTIMTGSRSSVIRIRLNVRLEPTMFVPDAPAGQLSTDEQTGDLDDAVCKCSE